MWLISASILANVHVNKYNMAVRFTAQNSGIIGRRFVGLCILNNENWRFIIVHPVACNALSSLILSLKKPDRSKFSLSEVECNPCRGVCPILSSACHSFSRYLGKFEFVLTI